MIRRRAIAWLGALLAFLWYFVVLGPEHRVDAFQSGDYGWLVAGREMRLDPGTAWDSPWVAYWRPVTKALFAFATGLFGEEAPPYLALTLLLHLCNGLLIADIALKFRAGPFAAAIGSLYFLLAKHHIASVLSVAGLSVVFPAFLALAGLRLGIARGTFAHIVALFVLTATLWARETYAALPIVVVLLLPGEERGWAHLTPRFAASLVLLSVGFLVLRWTWQSSVSEAVAPHLDDVVDGSFGGLLTNIWALLRVGTLPPRHVDPDGFWVALLFFMMALSFGTHLPISRHRILRLLLGGFLVFLPSALLHSARPEEAIPFAEPHHLYAPACFAAIAVCLLLTLRPTDQSAAGDPYEEGCMRTVGEFLTVTLVLVLLVRNADLNLTRADEMRERARSQAAQLEGLASKFANHPPGSPAFLVAQRTEEERNTLPAPPGELRSFLEWRLPGRSAELRTQVGLDPRELRKLDAVPGRRWLASFGPTVEEMAVLFWTPREQAYVGALPAGGTWNLFAPTSEDFGTMEFRIQGVDRTLAWKREPSYGPSLASVHPPLEFRAEEVLRIEPVQGDLVPPTAILFLLRP